MSVNALELDVVIETTRSRKPFRITGHTQLTAEVVVSILIERE